MPVGRGGLTGGLDFEAQQLDVEDEGVGGFRRYHRGVRKRAVDGLYMIHVLEWRRSKRRGEARLGEGRGGEERSVRSESEIDHDKGSMRSAMSHERMCVARWGHHLPHSTGAFSPPLLVTYPYAEYMGGDSTTVVIRREVRGGGRSRAVAGVVDHNEGGGRVLGVDPNTKGVPPGRGDTGEGGKCGGGKGGGRLSEVEKKTTHTK